MNCAKHIRTGAGALAIAGLLGAAGCESPGYHTRETFPAAPESRRIVLLPPDVELSLLHAGGGQEVNAEWTRLARRYLTDDLVARLKKIKASLVERKATAGDFGDDPEENQLLKLHEAVGAAILIYQQKGAWQLPTKAGKFDWSLGSEARHLRDKYGADYALFVFLRDSYSSSGRVAAMIIAAPFGGIRGGMQLGFSSLVNIHTGEVVWFNHLARTSGDLRTPEGARETLDTLFKSFPK